MGGFGTVAWVDVKEYDMAKPDVIAVNGAEKTLQVLPKKTNSFNCGKYVIMSCNTSMQSFHKWKNKEFCCVSVSEVLSFLVKFPIDFCVIYK